jgi:hypothetical protein
MNKRIAEELRACSNAAAQSTASDGLTFERGTAPSADQVAIATVRTREDLAMLAGVLVVAWARMDKAIFWLKVIAALLVVDILHRW